MITTNIRTALKDLLSEDLLRPSLRLRFRGYSIPKGNFAKLILLLSLAALFTFQATAQNPPPPPPPAPAVESAAPPAPSGPALTEKQLENLVARIALYPDRLLAQIVTASTFWDEIPEAAILAMTSELRSRHRCISAARTGRA
jgi:hypothetical protein